MDFQCPFNLNHENLGARHSVVIVDVELAVGKIRISSGSVLICRTFSLASSSGIEPSRFLVRFLAGDPGLEAREKVLQIKTDPEEIRIARQEPDEEPAGLDA